MDAIADTRRQTSRQIAGGGTPEAAWLAWPNLAATPRLSLNAHLPQGVRLVVVAPHPDDEVLSCGGLLGSHAARGGACLVVAVTDGEASHTGSRSWRPSELARARRTESAQGLETLGIRRADTVRLGLPDGRVRQHATHLVSGLHLMLRPTDVVVSTWRRDGHPDHEATGEAVAMVCARNRCRFMEAPVWMWHWAEPGHPQVPWHRLMGFDLSGEAVALKRQALAAHVTQLSPRDIPGTPGTQDMPETAPVLGTAIQERAMRHTEFFFVAP